MAASSPCFSIIAPHRLHTRRWGDQAVVYDDRTGDTHLLGALAIDVLGELRRCALNRDALLERLDDADPDAVEEALAKLTEVKICAVAR